MKRNENIIVIFAVVFGSIGLLLGVYSLFSVSRITDNVVLPNKPIHWHPNLRIIIKGEEIGIPANIGMGTSYSSSPFYDSMMGMTNMHTHDDSSTLHWEVMMHAPTREDMYLGNFFQVWGKTFNKNCIFEFCNGSEGSVKMFINNKLNNKLNNKFDKYIVRDGDEIVIEFI
ncbi:MAG: hypothetical protein HYW23_02450 [Candidatus Aenigmarchaeota archaeon]|nr:hypothetical protein [Candidatus Aenigmarchaeota archaeon]